MTNWLFPKRLPLLEDDANSYSLYYMYYTLPHEDIDYAYFANYIENIFYKTVQKDEMYAVEMLKIYADYYLQVYEEIGGSREALVAAEHLPPEPDMFAVATHRYTSEQFALLCYEYSARVDDPHIPRMIAYHLFRTLFDNTFDIQTITHAPAWTKQDETRFMNIITHLASSCSSFNRSKDYYIHKLSELMLPIWVYSIATYNKNASAFVAEVFGKDLSNKKLLEIVDMDIDAKIKELPWKEASPSGNLLFFLAALVVIELVPHSDVVILTNYDTVRFVNHDIPTLMITSGTETGTRIGYAHKGVFHVSSKGACNALMEWMVACHTAQLEAMRELCQAVFEADNIGKSNIFYAAATGVA